MQVWPRFSFWLLASFWKAALSTSPTMPTQALGKEVPCAQMTKQNETLALLLLSFRAQEKDVTVGGNVHLVILFLFWG